MLRIEASTPKLTASTSIISDIAEDLQLANYTSNHSSPSAPKNLLATNEILSTSSIELLPKNSQILDKSPELLPREADIDAFTLNKNPTQTINSIAEKPQTSTTKTDTITGERSQPATHNNIPIDSGIFQADKTGKTSFDYLSDLRTSETDKELIADATPKTEAKLAEKKAEATFATNPVETKPENSPATETKSPKVSEIPNSHTNPVETTTDSPPVETKNSTVSEICTCATNPAETKTDKSPAVEAKNPTISEIPKDDPKTENPPATEIKKPTVSSIPKDDTTPVDPKTDSPSVETKKPTVSSIPKDDPTPVDPKTENSPATETKNQTIS